MSKIKVVMDPEQRQKYINMLLELDGLSHIQEDPNAAYCPISLTSTPDELKDAIKSRQHILMNEVLGVAGINAYDPGSAPYSPDTNLTSQPNEVYVVDSGKIVGARFFVGHNILPSTGQGIEAEKAKVYNRMAVMLMDKNMRVSRMQPHRAIYLEYDSFQEKAEQFIPVFQMLQSYEPGMGFNGQLPVLLGFEKTGNGIVDLEETVYREFPQLQYKYDGHTPILKLRSENPQLFYEKREI
jgi:hypothetical protein